MKLIKKVSLIFVLLFSMIGLSGCGGPKIVDEYYEFNDWLNENIEFKEDGQAGSKYIYTMTNKSEYNLDHLSLALVPEDKSDIKKLVKQTKEFKEYGQMTAALDIQGAATMSMVSIDADTTLNLYSDKEIDVENCKIIYNDTLASIEEGKIKKDSALKDSEQFKQYIEDCFSDKPTGLGGAITVTNDGESEYVLNDNKVIYQYSITNDGGSGLNVLTDKIVSRKTGESPTSFYPLQEGLIRPSSKVTVGAGETVKQGCEENITDPIYLSNEIVYY